MRTISVCRRLTIGRGAGCDVVVDDALVSATHAEIVRHGLRYLVRDLGSRRGTFVGSHRVGEATLDDGTELVHDDSVLVDWGNNVAYELTFSCDQACYDANQDDIAAIVKSLTVEEPE